MVSSTQNQLQITNLDLDKLNQRFESAHPQDILAWCVNNVPTGLVQTSAFNVDDMVVTDILYRQLQPERPVPVLFLDTLHHFRETLEFVERARQHYDLDLRTYKNDAANSREEFADRYGEALWDKDIAKFHDLTKIQPLHRGLDELDAIAWITGRRRDQAPTRAQMPIVETDKKGRLKVNPLANWTRQDSWKYAGDRDLIYNPLHDRGYPSIGDEPITTPVSENEDERAGRWRGSGKTECGIHL
jgi:phosphoadenosine phosphosulfate reductase